MSDWLIALLDRLATAAPIVIYPVLGLAAALENLIPPIPADMVVLFGGVLAGRGGAEVRLVFLAVWLSNVAGALVVYGIGRRFGPTFFSGRWGRLLLRPRQLERLNGFYRTYGFWVILLSRFLPMFRAVVPVFAGVARLGFWRTALPIALASGAWYGLIVYAGAAAGRNVEEILTRLQGASRWLGVAAAMLAVLAGAWWWRTRGSDR